MAHIEGRTPGKTPETRTRSRHYQHPQADGRVSYGDESWPILDGVVYCPLEVGDAAGWPIAAEASIRAYEAGGGAVPQAAADAAVAEQQAGARCAAVVKVLEGTVGNVADALDGPVEGTVLSVDELRHLQTLEAAGKNRKGVLEVLALHLEALAPVVAPLAPAPDPHPDPVAELPMADATNDTALFSLETLKAWLQVTGVDDSANTRLVVVANAATAEIEQAIGVVFVTRAVSDTFDGDGKCGLILSYAPVVAITSVTVSGSVLDPSVYSVTAESGVLTLSSGVFTEGRQNVVVAYTAGYDEQDGDHLPADIVEAGLNLAKARYDELTTGSLIATSVSLGPGSMVVKAAKRPPSVQSVIDSWNGSGYRP